MKTAWRKKCNTSNGARGGREAEGLPDNDGNDNVAAWLYDKKTYAAAAQKTPDGKREVELAVETAR